MKDIILRSNIRKLSLTASTSAGGSAFQPGRASESEYHELKPIQRDA